GLYLGSESGSNSEFGLGLQDSSSFFNEARTCRPPAHADAQRGCARDRDPEVTASKAQTVWGQATRWHPTAGVASSHRVRPDPADPTDVEQDRNSPQGRSDRCRPRSRATSGTHSRDQNPFWRWTGPPPERHAAEGADGCRP